MNVKDTNCERAKAHGGNRGGKSPSMFETRCYDRVLGCEQQNQSSALFRDAELVDRPNEVMCPICLLCLRILDVTLASLPCEVPMGKDIVGDSRCLMGHSLLVSVPCGRCTQHVPAWRSGTTQ